MIKIQQIKELHNFEPKYTYSELLQILPQGHGERRVNYSRLYKFVKDLTSKAYPTEENAYDKRWMDFYLPLKRRGFLILVPISVMLYEQRFFLHLIDSNIEVNKGKEKGNDFLTEIIEQTIHFYKIIKKEPGIVEKSLPHDIRTGRVLGKYIMEDLFPMEKKQEILRKYKDHVNAVGFSHPISLSDYLNTAAICYKAAFGNKAEGLTAKQMYRKWADGRDCGMLEIQNKNSKAEFEHWLDTKSHCGGHPFEIIYSWHGHGIHLIPPDRHKPCFALRVTDYTYARSFIEMIKALIEKGLPFEAHNLEMVLDYLSGDSYFTVNAYSKHFILYDSRDRKLFRHIDWDEVKMVKWK